MGSSSSRRPFWIIIPTMWCWNRETAGKERNERKTSSKDFLFPLTLRHDKNQKTFARNTETVSHTLRFFRSHRNFVAFALSFICEPFAFASLFAFFYSQFGRVYLLAGG